MARQSTQITLRGLDPRVFRALRSYAQREGISLNKAALRLIAKGSGVGERGKARDIDRIGSALDAWIGTWTKREANAVLDSVRSLEQVDPDLWT